MFDDCRSWHEWAQGLSDDEWCTFLAGKEIDGHIPPPLPSEEFQRAWVGNAGLDTFDEAMGFCRHLKSTLRRAGYKVGPNSRLLDVGVGWGRLYRVLMRETPHIVGIDVVPDCIEMCRSALPGGKFEIAPVEPPYHFLSGEFDVVYLYSVFSHLNEPSFLSILRETARLLRDNGFLVFTTVPPAENVLRSIGFPETWKADADAGRFLYVPTGGGHEKMPSSVWGWVHLSEAYLRRILVEFPLRLIAYDGDQYPQAFVALIKEPTQR